MNYKNAFDNWIGFVAGVFGGGMGYTLQIAWHAELVKLLVAAATAFIAGVMGVAGKYFFLWLWKKLLIALKIKN